MSVPVTTECVVKIVVPDDEIINIWIPSISMKESESNNEYVSKLTRV